MCSLPKHGSVLLAVLMGNPLAIAMSWVSPTTDVLHGGLAWRTKHGNSPRIDCSWVKIVKYLLLEKVLFGRSISSQQIAVAVLGDKFIFNVINIRWGPSAVHGQQARGLPKDEGPGALRGQRGQTTSAFCRTGERALCN